MTYKEIKALATSLLNEGLAWKFDRYPHVTAIARACLQLLGEGNELADTASRTVNKLREIQSDEEFLGVFGFAAAHGIQYKGPEFGTVLEELKAALAKWEGK